MNDDIRAFIRTELLALNEDFESVDDVVERIMDAVERYAAYAESSAALEVSRHD